MGKHTAHDLYNRVYNLKQAPNGGTKEEPM